MPKSFSGTGLEVELYNRLLKIPFVCVWVCFFFNLIFFNFFLKSDKD